MRSLRELLLGARMALAGGASAWLRATLTGLGVGLGVATLLVAVSVPHAAAARHAREAARVPGYADVAAADTTMLVTRTSTEFRGRVIIGVLVQPDGARPPLPPGVAAIPAPGELVVSPALAELLASPDAELLRERLDYPIVGTIGEPGLSSPSDLYFYLGVDSLDDPAVYWASRVAGFGTGVWQGGFDPVLAMIVVVIVVVLLLPIGLFVATATRFGSEARDRRLAGVRLLGADARMTRRIAAGEALAGSGLGLLVGAAVFLVGRSVVDRVEVMGFSAFPADLRPDPALTLLLVVGVPAIAVLMTMVAMRRVVVEPLGVTRRSADVRRRVWWRLLLPAAGVALLVPLFGDLSAESDQEVAPVNGVQVAVGLSLILVGVAVLLPWLVQVTIGRLRGGPVAWQLATRRLQLDASTATRAVVGIAVAVAGAIGVQTVFASFQATYRTGTGASAEQADAVVYRNGGGWDELQALDAALRETAGVVQVHSSASLVLASVDSGQSWTGSTLTIAECPTLAEIAELDSCKDGDVFVLTADPAWGTLGPAPGDRALVDGMDVTDPQEWVVPGAARSVRARSTWVGGVSAGAVLATPSALPPELLDFRVGSGFAGIWLDSGDAAAIERVRTTVWRAGSGNAVWFVGALAEDEEFATVRQGLVAGAAVLVVLIGLSLVIAMIDQLRERRRALAGLVAFGARRRTLAWSIFWQAAVPVGLGLGLALAAGLTVAWTVLRIAGQSLAVDWPAVGVVSGIAASVVLAATALGVPVLWRLMRADGLRTE